MGLVNYVLPLVLVVVIIFVDVLCVDISSKKRDYVSPIHRDNQNLPKPDQPLAQNTSLSNLEWPDIGHNPRRNPPINTSTLKPQNPLPNQSPPKQNTPINSPWDTSRSTSATKPSPSRPQPNKPSYASVAFINNERGDGQVASATSNHNNNNNPPSPQLSISTKTATNNNPPPTPNSSTRSPINNNPTTPHASTINNNKPSQSSPQSWPRPPANPQSHLKPISASGNKKPETAENANNQQTNPTEDQELREFSENLLRKETNSAMNTITVNYQGQTTSRSLKDEAPLPLIAVTNKTFQVPTIELLRPLYDNYILETTQNEHVTPMEREEENKLLDAVVNSQVMRFTRNFLIDKGKIGKDPKEFRDYLKQIWFTMYSRGRGKIGSSGFEHVFLTEIRDSQISGLHNWLYFYEEESRGNADYLGYMRKIEFGNKGSILKFHFKFRNIDKPVGSMFIGTSPEFEMALYTTCFALRANRICPLQLDGKRFIIRTYSMRYRGKENIGSAFPEI